MVENICQQGKLNVGLMAQLDIEPRDPGSADHCLTQHLSYRGSHFSSEIYNVYPSFYSIPPHWGQWNEIMPTTHFYRLIIIIKYVPLLLYTSNNNKQAVSGFFPQIKLMQPTELDKSRISMALKHWFYNFYHTICNSCKICDPAHITHKCIVSI